MRKMINLSLPTEMIGEILNHLEDEVEVWKNTEEYLASGSIVAPCFIANCSSVRKARSMIRLYNGAISTLEKLLKSK